MSKLDKTFTATLQKGTDKGAWTCVIWPKAADFFGTRRLVKVRGTIDGEPFESSFIAQGDGTHRLPVKATLRKTISKESRRPRNWCASRNDSTSRRSSAGSRPGHRPSRSPGGHAQPPGVEDSDRGERWRCRSRRATRG